MFIKRFLLMMLSFVIAIELLSFCPNPKDIEPVCFNLENRVVEAYLADADANYSNGIGRYGISRLNYKVLGSTISPYLGLVEEDCPNWVEQPAGVILPTVGGSTVEISDSPFFSQKFVYMANGDSTYIYNLVPQTIYWYKVFNSSSKEISSGIFKTLGKVRMIKSKKILNVRDIGGWECEGGRLAYGKIIRSATLDGSETSDGAVDEDDIHMFVDNIGIQAELDLRKNSIGKSPLGAGIDYYHSAINHYMYLMTNTYKSGSSVLTGTYPSEVASCLKWLLNNMQEEKGTIVHCTWGADRTGTLLMIIEALCGVSEADIVKDWELTSFNGALYRKYIDQEELSYYYLEGNSVKKTHAEMRSTFQYLYDYYGGASGSSIKEQVIAWLEDTAFSEMSDKGASIIEALRGELIVPVVKSPIIIKDLSKEIGANQYSITYDSTKINSNSCLAIDPKTGNHSESDIFSSTDFINCYGYSTLLLNVVTQDIAAFYDKDKKFIGGIKDVSIHGSQGCETVLFDYREYDIPSDAVYVKLNMAKNSGWTAVLSEESLLE